MKYWVAAKIKPIIGKSFSLDGLKVRLSIIEPGESMLLRALRQ